MRRTPFLLAGAIAGCALLLAAATPASAQSGKVWKHGILKAKSDAGIYFMAGKRDFAKKLGLNLEYVELSNDVTGLKAMLAGELDSFEGGPQAALLAGNRGADAKVVGCQWLAVPHGIFVHKDIHSLKDLQGKSVAISAPGSLPDLLARGAFEGAGIPVSSVKLASLGADLDRYKALIAGVVQAAVVSAEYAPIAEKEGVKILVPGSVAMPDAVRTCIHMTGKTIAQRNDDAVKFLAAEMQGLRYAVAHEDEVVKLTRELTSAKEDDPRPAFMFEFAVKTKAVAPELPIPLKSLSWMQDQLVTVGSLNKAGDINKLVDQSVREKALVLAGKTDAAASMTSAGSGGK